MGVRRRARTGTFGVIVGLTIGMSVLCVVEWSVSPVCEPVSNAEAAKLGLSVMEPTREFHWWLRTYQSHEGIWNRCERRFAR